MPLPESGQLSLADIAAEFGGDAPHALSEYYGVSNGIPESGLISLSDFYGAANVPNINFFSDPGWQNSTGWAYSQTGNGAGFGASRSPERNANRVRLHTEVIGTFPSTTWYENQMVRTLTIPTAGTYRAWVRISAYLNMFGGPGFGVLTVSGAASGSGTTAFMDAPGPPWTLFNGYRQFTAVANDTITITVRAANTLTETWGAYMDVAEVYLERV